MDDWQVESGKRKTVFVSSTSKDLGACREIVKNILIDVGLYPSVQDHFGPDWREIETLIYEKIRDSDAVICLIGHYCGVIPSKASPFIRSYTQIEFDSARNLNKPVFLFLASDNYTYSSSLEEPVEKKMIQQKYREDIIKGKFRYDSFSSNDELERKIRKAITPILIHSTKKVLTKIHPPPTPAYFVGREEELSQLNQAIFQRDPGIIVILGMGGQGKTTLLFQTIRKMKYLPFYSGIWVEALCGGFTFYDFLDAALAVFLEKRVEDKKESDFQIRLQTLIGYLQNKPCLIVIDGVEKWLQGWSGISNPDINTDLNIFSLKGIHSGFDDFLKQCSSLDNGSHLIFTTRAIPSALDGLKYAVLPVLPHREKYTGLQGLQPEDAVNLLKTMGVVASRRKLEEIASRFFYHPLAITNFAGYAVNYGSKWEKYLIPKGINAIDTLNNLLNETRKHLPDPTISEQLLKLASLSIDNISIRLLNWLWHFDSLSRNESEEWLILKVITLANWNIFSWNPENQTVNFHPLIKEYFTNLWLKEESFQVHARIGAWHNSFDFINDDISLEGARNKILAVKHYLLSGNINIALQIMFGKENNREDLFSWFVRYGHLWECSELILEITSYCTDELKGQCILARSSVLNDLDLIEIAKDDIDEAITLFESKNDNENPSIILNLAKCYGSKGTLFLERNKTCNAISLFDNSLKLLKLASERGVTDHVEIAKAFTNRGLAFKGIGDFISASRDFSAAIEEINKINIISDELSIFRTEILLLSIKMRFAEGNLDKPLCELTEFVLELTKHQEKEIRKVNRNYLLSVIFLGSAWNLRLKPQNAIASLNEVVIPLNKLESEGIKNIRAILALGLVNRSQSYCLMGQYSDALEDLNIAITLYYDHIKGNRIQYKGQLSNAFFIRAKINYLLNKFNDGRADIDEAIKLSHEWIDLWFDDCDIKNIYLDNAIETLSFLPESHIIEKKEILKGIFMICDRLISANHSVYLTQKAIERIKMFNQFIKNRAKEVNADLPTSFLSLINDC